MNMINAFAQRNNAGTQKKRPDKESEREILMRICLITGRNTAAH